MKIRIGIDASGGDWGSACVLPGAITAAASNSKINIVVFGAEDEIIKGLGAPYMLRTNNLDIVNCKNTQEELSKALEYLYHDKISALITASNSRKLAAATAIYLPDRKLRIGLLAPCPTSCEGKLTYFADAGATFRIKDPEIFLFWAKCGRNFLVNFQNIPEPKIGLLNIAEERADPQTTQIHQAIKESNSPGYIGYVEPHKFFNGEVDLTLMDGREGNLMLKAIEEAVALTMKKSINTVRSFEGADLALRALQAQLFSYEAHLLSPVLGLDRWIFRVHGRCDADQLSAAILLAVQKYPLQNSLKIFEQDRNILYNLQNDSFRNRRS